MCFDCGRASDATVRGACTKANDLFRTAGATGGKQRCHHSTTTLTASLCATCVTLACNGHHRNDGDDAHPNVLLERIRAAHVREAAGCGYVLQAEDVFPICTHTLTSSSARQRGHAVLVGDEGRFLQVLVGAMWDPNNAGACGLLEAAIARYTAPTAMASMAAVALEDAFGNLTVAQLRSWLEVYDPQGWRRLMSRRGVKEKGDLVLACVEAVLEGSLRWA